MKLGRFSLSVDDFVSLEDHKAKVRFFALSRKDQRNIISLLLMSDPVLREALIFFVGQGICETMECDKDPKWIAAIEDILGEGVLE